MTIIRIDPQQLEETSALMTSVAAEYDALASALAYADLTAMPANVAGVVGSQYADVRTRLASVTTDLAGEARSLQLRSSIALEDGGLGTMLDGSVFQEDEAYVDYFGDFDVGLTGLGAGLACLCCSGVLVGSWPAPDETEQESAVSAAWGPGVSGGGPVDTIEGGTFTIGGDGGDVGTVGGDGYTFTLGGDGGDVGTIQGGTFTIDVGGYGPDAGTVGDGYTFTLGGDGGDVGTIQGGTFTIDVGGYGPDAGTIGDGYTFNVGPGGEGGISVIEGQPFTLIPTDLSGYTAFTGLIQSMQDDINNNLANIDMTSTAVDPVSNMIAMQGYRDVMRQQTLLGDVMSPLFNPDSSAPDYYDQFTDRDFALTHA